MFSFLVVLLTVIGSVVGICDYLDLNIDHWHCQPLGPGGLDSTCVKIPGKCSGVRTAAPTHNNSGRLPPDGYLSNLSDPPSCVALKKAASLVRGMGFVPVYRKAQIIGNNNPRVNVNPVILEYLNITTPLHDCIENNVPWGWGRWNWLYPEGQYFQGERVDSFYFIDDAGATHWSYQCYCDICKNCQEAAYG